MAAPDKRVQGEADDGEALAEAKFREMADGVPLTLWRADEGGRVIWLSRPWLDLVGRPLDQELGHGWKSGLHPDDADSCIAAFAEAFDRRSAFDLRYRVRAADGSWRWIVDTGAPSFAGDRFTGFRGSRRDITELVELRTHKEVLLSELHHRVKNNLQLIIAFLSFSMTRAKGEEARGLLAAAIRRVKGVGAVQEQLHRRGGETVDLAEYLPLVARSVVGDDHGDTLKIQVERVSSPFPQAASLGLIVSELISEAARRHGAAGAPLVLSLARLGEGHAELVVTAGGPAAARADTLVAALARHAKATVTRSPEGGGFVRLNFPVRARPAAAVSEPNETADVFFTSSNGDANMSKEGVKGATQKGVGAVKEGVGKAVGNERMQAEGAADKAAGAAKEAVGKAKDAVHKASR